MLRKVPLLESRLDFVTICETNASGSTIEAWYNPGVGFRRSGASYYFRENGIGSTLQVTNNVGATVNRYEYDSYGVTSTFQEGQVNLHKFAGKHGYYSDNDSGMQLLGRRYYLPMLGRFLTQDPLGHGAGLNLYQYASQNPLVNIDPLGLDDLSAKEKNQVERAISRIENVGYKGVAGDLRTMLKRGQIDSTKDDKDGTIAHTDWGLFETSGRARIHIHRGDWLTNDYPEGSWADYDSQVTLTATLVHEWKHAKTQGGFWQYFHLGEREDRAYGFETRFLIRWRDMTTDKQRIETINSKITDITTRDK